MTSVIDQLKTYRNGYVAPLKFRQFSLVENADLTSPSTYIKPNVSIRTEAVLKFDQIMEDHPQAMTYARERAAVTIARTLYEDVIDDLIDIREEMWKDSPRYDDKVFKKVNALLSRLELR